MQLSRRQILMYGLLGGAAAVVPFGSRAASAAVAASSPVPTTVLSGDRTLQEGFTVPPGEVCFFDPDVSTTVVVGGNVVVEGTLVMRPAAPGVVHTLRFEGVDEERFVGGDTSVPLDSDVGLWIVGAGVLDAQGTPRVGWNRSGDDESWLATDELIVAPNAPGDITGFRPFVKGGSVPSQVGPNGVVYPTEVANLTRNVRIEGTPTGRAHIVFLRSQRPQTIRHVAIRYMGPQQGTGATFLSGGDRVEVRDGVLGRYGLHFHHCDDGSRGSLIEGVVVRNAGSQAFVPHTSHGITFRDCVAYDVRSAGFWWDFGAETNDTTFERCAVLGLPRNPGNAGLTLAGFLHNLGVGNVARGCVVVGVQNKKVNSGGYLWPSKANNGNNAWLWEDNTAHNNLDAGIGVWQNGKNPHLVTGYTGYHNGTGISHGAYQNTYTYVDAVTFRNGIELVQHALGPINFERAILDGNVLITKHSLPSESVTRYVDCLVTGTVVVAESGFPGLILFESSVAAYDLQRERFRRESAVSDIWVVNSDGSTFKI